MSEINTLLSHNNPISKVKKERKEKTIHLQILKSRNNLPLLHKREGNRYS